MAATFIGSEREDRLPLTGSRLRREWAICESRAQWRALARGNEWSCRIALVDAGVPEVDLELVDLLDQHGDRLSRCAQLLAVVRGQSGAPAAKDLEPLLV